MVGNKAPCKKDKLKTFLKEVKQIFKEIVESFHNTKGSPGIRG